MGTLMILGVFAAPFLFLAGLIYPGYRVNAASVARGIRKAREPK
jgi:hypothetical protein